MLHKPDPVLYKILEEGISKFLEIWVISNVRVDLWIVSKLCSP